MKKKPRRSEKISIVLTVDELGRLDAHAEDHVWTRSTAARELLVAALENVAKRAK